MTKQTIGIGAAANDGTGDPLRTAFGKINDNFDELYVAAANTSNSWTNPRTENLWEMKPISGTVLLNFSAATPNTFNCNTTLDHTTDNTIRIERTPSTNAFFAPLAAGLASPNTFNVSISPGGYSNLQASVVSLESGGVFWEIQLSDSVEVAGNSASPASPSIVTVDLTYMPTAKVWFDPSAMAGYWGGFRAASIDYSAFHDGAAYDGAGHNQMGYVKYVASDGLKYTIMSDDETSRYDDGVIDLDNRFALGTNKEIKLWCKTDYIGNVIIQYTGTMWNTADHNSAADNND